MPVAAKTLWFVSLSRLVQRTDMSRLAQLIYFRGLASKSFEQHATRA
jgi:hypothetical protein